MQDLRARVEEAVELLAKNQNPVKAKADAIKQVRSKDFWATVAGPSSRRAAPRASRHHEVPAADADDARHTAGLRRHRRRVLGARPTSRGSRASTSSSTSGGSSRCCASTSPRTPILQTDPRRPARARRGARGARRLVLQIDDKANVKHLAGHDPETRRSLADGVPRPGGPRRRGRRASASPSSCTSIRGCRRSSFASCRCCRTTSPRTAASRSSASTSRRSPPSTPRASTASSRRPATSTSFSRIVEHLRTEAASDGIIEQAS